MIYTLTCNPSLDYMTQVSDFQMGKTNRAISEYMVVGGKGINVSLMLRNLGYNSTCLGFVAGFTGKEIIKQIQESGLNSDFIELPDGMSRVNIKLSSHESENLKTLCETEINGMGPEISTSSVMKLDRIFEKVEAGDILILSGSVPKSLPDTFYEGLMEQLWVKDVKIIVDATGNLLLNVLSKSPFLIKPNKQELEEVCRVTINSKEQLIECGKKMQIAGAKNVLISLGEEGAFLFTENGEIYSAKAPKGELMNGVGAGDSMIAGFMAGYLEMENYEFAFRMSVAAGSASAFSKSFAQREEVESLMSVIQIEKM